MEMRTAVQFVAILVYGVFASGCLAAGTLVLLVGFGFLPAFLKNAIVEESHGDLQTLHIIQEFGSILVLVGLITFWFVRHYRQSRAFHWSMTAAWGLIAMVHWIDVRGPRSSFGGPLVTIG